MVLNYIGLFCISFGTHEPVQYISVLEAKLLLIATFPRIQIFTQGFQFCPDNSPALLIKTIDLCDLLLFDEQCKCQERISEKGTNVPSFSIRCISNASRAFLRSSIMSDRRSV